jgi:hypothetical protein
LPIDQNEERGFQTNDFRKEIITESYSSDSDEDDSDDDFNEEFSKFVNINSNSEIAFLSVYFRIAPSSYHRVQTANPPLDTYLNKKIKKQIKFLSDFLY